LDSLTERSLLKETRDGYVLHDVLREVMQGRLSVRRKEEIHRLIGVFFVSEARAGHARSALLSCHHFMEASELGATADALLQYGVTLLNEGYLEETLRCIGELLVRDTKMGDILPAKKRDALTCLLGNLLTFTGKIEEAKELLTELGGRLECGGDAGLVHAKVHNGLGIIAYREGLRDTAIEHYERAMGMARACREKEFVAKVLSNLGVLYWEGNEGEKARAAHLEAMELCWGLDDREGVARAYNNIGIISFKEGKPEEAARMFHKGLSISRKTGSMRIAAVALNNLGDAHREMGEAVKARDFYQKGLELARKHDFKRHQAVALKALAGMSRGSERAEYEEMAEELFSVLGMGPGDIDES